MNLIFLDFDGVMNSIRTTISRITETKNYRSFMERHQQELDPVAVRLVGRLAEEVNAKVIISSSWRKIHSLDEINVMLDFHGGPQAIDVTPSVPSGFRGDEVDLFLRQHPELFDPMVDKYVIFDDDRDFHQTQPFIHVNLANGFGLEHFVKALETFDANHKMLDLKVYVDRISRG